MLFADAKLYPVTDVGLSGLSHSEQVVRLGQGGATLVQLREKNLSPREFCEQAAAALRAARELGVRIVINDRVDLALALKADGVHLGQDDLPPREARRLLGGSAIIGFSTHNIEQARYAATLPVDYIAIGPIFATSSKDNSEPVLGPQVLRDVREAIGNIPLVAIGGITSETAVEVITAGANSVAMIRALLKEPLQITVRTRQILSLF
jgi:thiamine-phosphate pyrophosphorylase